MDKHVFRNERDLIVYIEQCINAPELEKLVQQFHGRIPVFNNFRDRVNWLADFSSVWDFRARQKKGQDVSAKENARWLIQNDSLSTEQEETALALAQRWGMIEHTSPCKKKYDAILILGGARMSCLYRTRYAKQLVQKQGVKTAQIAALTGMRPIADSERTATDTYAPDASTEYDLMKAAVIQSFRLSGDWKKRGEASERPNSSWVLETYEKASVISVLAAPSSRPEERRANTADTLLFWSQLSESQGCKDILMVTSQIYVPYQHLEAVRTLGLPCGFAIETVGFPREWSSSMQGLQTAANYLQEIRSTILSANKIIEYRKEKTDENTKGEFGC